MGHTEGGGDGWRDGWWMRACMHGWKRSEGMLDGWDRGRKGVADRQAGRGVGQRVVGVLQLPQLLLAGHSRWGNQALLPGNSPRPTAVQQCCGATGAAPMALRTGGATALQQLELMSLHYNCAHGFTTIRVPGHVSASQLCTDSPSLMSQWCLRSPGSPEAMSLVTSPCHSHARSLLMTSVPGDARPTAVPTVSSFPVSLVPSSCHSCAHSFAITSIPGHVAELPPHSNWHTQ